MFKSFSEILKLKMKNSLKNKLILINELKNNWLKNKVTIKASNFSDIPISFFYPPIEEACKGRYKISSVTKVTPKIEFFSVFGDASDVQKSEAEVKIFYTGECVSNETKKREYSRYSNHLVDYCDLSLGFEHLNHNNYIRFPLWMLYYFKLTDNIDTVNNRIKKFNNNFYNKKEFCALIARHDISGIRTKIFNDISSINRVNCPGKFLHNDDSLIQIYQDNKTKYLRNFKFNICPENTQSDGYVTEKIFQALDAGCIPIYNGWNNDPEKDIINPKSFIWWDEQNSSEAIDIIKFLSSNESAYKQFRKENKPFVSTAPEKIYSMLVNINNRLKEIVEHKLYF